MFGVWETKTMSEIISYKCPNCGGPLIFDPKKQKYACEYCLSEFTQKETADGEQKEPEAGKKKKRAESLCFIPAPAAAPRS